MMIMDVPCWNCKKTIGLEEGRVATAIKQMDEQKISFFDVPCPSCQKVNRIERAKFVSAYTHRQETAKKTSKKAKRDK